MEKRPVEHERKASKWLLWILVIIVEVLILIVLAFFVKNNIFISVLIAVSFQIPLAIRSIATSRKVKKVCYSCSILLLTAGVVGILGCYGRNYYIESLVPADNIKTEDDKDQLLEEISVLPRLEEEPDVYFERNMPVINGPVSLLPLYASIVDMVYPDITQTLNQKDSYFRCNDEVWEELFTGKTDVVFSWEVSEAILAKAKEYGATLEVTPIALDAFVFLNNRENLVSDLTQAQLKNIYTGNVVNWNELGGNDEMIVAFQKDKGSALQNRLEEFMGDMQLAVPEQELQIDLKDGVVEAASTYINYEGAIGFSFWHHTQGIESDRGIKFLKVDGVEPEERTIKNGQYPLIETVYCVTLKEHANTNVEKLLEWILSDQGQRLIEACGYVKIKEEK